MCSFQHVTAVELFINLHYILHQLFLAVSDKLLYEYGVSYVLLLPMVNTLALLLMWFKVGIE